MQIFQPKVVPVKSTKSLSKVMESANKLMNWFPIGSRVRYYPELEKNSAMDSLIMGYAIDKVQIYRQCDIRIDQEGGQYVMWLKNQKGQAYTIDSYEEFRLIIPSGGGEEKKLDYLTRANLGRRGQFGKFTKLIMHTQQHSRDNIMIETEVYRNVALKGGVHNGHQVALLNVFVGTAELYEPRSEMRISTHLPVTVSKNGEESIMAAVMLDVSESAMRLILEDEHAVWPEFAGKDFLVVGVKAEAGLPMQKFKCHLIRTDGNERVFSIDFIHRRGKYEAFNSLDAMELKIYFLNTQT